MRYIPHSKADVRAMLETIGADSTDELFDTIPKELRLQRDLDIPAPLSEPELMGHLTSLSTTEGVQKMSFLGAGAYSHHLPPAVDQMLLRSEFYTSYTPYQPEVSQGTLQAIFEFQTMICRLFGMGYANASMYDGASAAAEAALMTRRVAKKRHRILASKGLHPEYLDVIKTYLTALDGGDPDLLFVPLDPSTGATDMNALSQLLDDTVAGVLIGYPNFFGIVDDLDKVSEMAKSKGALTVSVTTEPYSLGTIAAPGTLGADIAVGEGQPIATPVSFGGPGLGLFAVRDDKKLLRQMPGRLSGQTKDGDGKVGYVLTLATREQHIRREKATSNICTNHGLCALSATINMSLLGKDGFSAASASCFSRAAYLKEALASVDGFSIAFSGPTFNEFALKCENRKARSVLESLDFFAGVDVGRFIPEMDDLILVAVTERHCKESLDAYIDALKSL